MMHRVDEAVVLGLVLALCVAITFEPAAVVPLLIALVQYRKVVK